MIGRAVLRACAKGKEDGLPPEDYFPWGKSRRLLAWFQEVPDAIYAKLVSAAKLHRCAPKQTEYQ